MNINCVICSDLFVPSAEVYATKCGHMFHFSCLLHWLERSPTCPQCRDKTTEKTIHKVYFNLANTDGITVDSGILQNKLQDLQLQVTLTEKGIKAVNEKYNKVKAQKIGLRQEVATLEEKIRSYENTIHALKDKMAYFKLKSKETDRLTEELTKLKHNIKNMENIQVAMNGTKEEVNEILRNEKNIESLALVSAILKKSLVDAERKKRDMEHNLKKAQNEATKFRRECNILECQNSDLKKELQNLRVNYEKEKQYLKSKIVELDQKISSMDNPNITNTSLKRIMTESPINCSRKPRLTSPENISDEGASPSVAEKVQKIVEFDSPYLPVKSSNIAIDYTSILNTKFQAKSGPSKNGYTIFKQPLNTLEKIKLSSNKEVAYNGLGSSSKEDIFPSPKPAQTGLKRPKSSSSVTSSKFRKLAPTSSKTKVTNFFSQRDSQ